MKKLNKEIFIERSNKIHNNKFDYSLVEYKNTRTPVKIICPKCGIFEQVPHSHIKGIGCAKCNLLTTNQFIERSIKKHGDKYNYDKVIINGNQNKVIINCKIHGDFEQRPDVHMNGQGCYKCFRERKKSTADEFIIKANKKHNNTYDYSLLEYKTNKHKVKIICKKHGSFSQSPQHHLNGSGCPICQTSKGEIKISNVLNINNIKYERQKTFENCNYKSKLRFDFYLPEYNTCIEYNGIQHYTPITFFGNLEGFNINKKRFKIKEKFCKENNINLTIIKYDDNIEDRLKNLFSF